MDYFGDDDRMTLLECILVLIAAALLAGGMLALCSTKPPTPMKYLILITLAMILAFTGFAYNNRKVTPPCRDGWPFHDWTRWEVAGKSTHTFSRDRLILKRHCQTCRQVQTKDSD